MDHEQVFAANRTSWNARVPIHLRSAFYDVEGFLAGEDSLNAIELDLLGSLEGERVLHLQCHFGQDTLSLARRGATVTGLDLSDVAIAAARELADRASLAARFVCSNVYDAEAALAGETFDVVYTSYGVLGWLPDLPRWARVVAALLRPGGRFVLVEFHPVPWMWDDGYTELRYPYDGGGEPIVETSSSTYADKAAAFSAVEVNYAHGIAPVVQAILDAGLRLERLAEHDWSPYDLYADSVEVAPGRFQTKFGDKLPLVFSLVARRPG
jgi:SAM-dependent methyltransferase